MAEGPSKTFFSYAREDSEFVLRLVKDMRAGGAAVWLDQLDIGPSMRWDEEVERALRECPRHVTVLSPSSVNSRDVRDEVSYALKQGKQVIPLLLRECEVPYRLDRLQYVDFRGDYDAGLRDLLKALEVVAPPAAPLWPVTTIPAQVRPDAPVLSPAAQLARAPEPPPAPTLSAGSKPDLVPAQVRDQAASKTDDGTVFKQATARKGWMLMVGSAVVLVIVLAAIWRMAANPGGQRTGMGSLPTPAPTPVIESTATPTPAPSSNVTEEAQAFYKRGQDYSERKEYDKAIEALTKSIRLRPDHLAYNERGNAYDYKGEYDRAIQDYDQALKLKPDYAVAYDNRGISYYLKGQSDRAIQDFDQALKLNPSYAFAYNNRGAANNSKGQYDQAIQDFDQALKLNPSLASAYIGRGLSYESKGEYSLAIQDFDRALKADPNDNVARAYRDRVAAKLKK